MLRRSSLFAALLLSALTMGLEFAHVLEWGPKASYPGPLYMPLQESLYDWYGNIGGVIYVLAVIATIMLAAQAWREHASRGLAVTAAAIEVAALVVFLTVVLPVNSNLPVHDSGAVPAGWAGLRNRWEAGHATGFALFTAAFIVLAIAALHGDTRLSAEIHQHETSARN